MGTPDTSQIIAARRKLRTLLNDEIMESLDILFPERTPRLNDSLDAIRYATGQRSVVLTLRSIYGEPDGNNEVRTG